jgi:predicted CopG family antitoxin
MATTIQISDETWKMLNNRKQRGESFEDVIKKALLEEPELNEVSKNECAGSD